MSERPAKKMRQLLQLVAWGTENILYIRTFIRAKIQRRIAMFYIDYYTTSYCSELGIVVACIYISLTSMQIGERYMSRIFALNLVRSSQLQHPSRYSSQLYTYIHPGHSISTKLSNLSLSQCWVKGHTEKEISPAVTGQFSSEYNSLLEQSFCGSFFLFNC